MKGSLPTIIPALTSPLHTDGGGQILTNTLHWWTYVFIQQDLREIFGLFQPPFRQISETNDTSSESPNIEHLETRKKFNIPIAAGNFDFYNPGSAYFFNLATFFEF